VKAQTGARLEEGLDADIDESVWVEGDRIADRLRRSPDESPPSPLLDEDGIFTVPLLLGRKSGLAAFVETVYKFLA
jgi:hypothetical protein